MHGRRASLFILCAAFVVGCASGPQGPEGPQGAEGQPGPKGDQGERGPDGTSVSQAPLAIGDANCPAGGVKLTSADGDHFVCNGAPGEPGLRGEKGDQGDQGVPGPQGIKGDPGAPGVSVTATALQVGDSQCPAGGVKYTSADGDHVVCNGAPGEQGPKGDQGVAGPQGIKGDRGDQGLPGVSVAGTSLSPGDAHCPSGGVKYTALDGDSFVCNGSKGDPGASVEGASVAVGDATCPYGGARFTTATGDVFACNGAPGSPGPKGDQGIQGPKGDQGAPGPQGDPGDPTTAPIPYSTYNATLHTVTTTTMTMAEALCRSRFGIWNASSGTCGSPLAYGTSVVTRTTTDATAIASCPNGYTPADCHTALFLLNFWRLNPNTEAPNGHAWCAGTVDGSLNGSQGLAGMPGYWYGAGAAAPNVCGSGQALVVDQCLPAENGCVGRPSYPRPQLYCQSVTQQTLWMCVSLNLP